MAYRHPCPVTSSQHLFLLNAREPSCLPHREALHKGGVVGVHCRGVVQDNNVRLARETNKYESKVVVEEDIPQTTKMQQA